MARKIFATTIEDQLQKAFKVACTMEGKNMNTVLEEFMEKYAKEVWAKRDPE